MSDDKKGIDQITQGDPEARDRFKRSYIERVQNEAIPALEQALAENDPSPLADLAHRFRAAALLFGFDALFDTLKSVDEAVDPPSDTNRWQQAARASIERFNESISKLEN